MKTIETLPGAEDELKASVQQLKRTLPVLAELVTQVAEFRMKSYKAHVDAGFTPEQALILCQRSSL